MAGPHDYDGGRCNRCGYKWGDATYWLSWTEDTCPPDSALIAERRGPHPKFKTAAGGF